MPTTESVIVRRPVKAARIQRATNQTEIERLTATPGVTLLKSRTTRQNLGIWGTRTKPVVIHRRIDLWHSAARGKLRECWIMTSTITGYEGEVARGPIGKIEEWEGHYSLDAAEAHWPYNLHQHVNDGLALPVVIRRAREFI